MLEYATSDGDYTIVEGSKERSTVLAHQGADTWLVGLIMEWSWYNLAALFTEFEFNKED